MKQKGCCYYMGCPVGYRSEMPGWPLPLSHLLGRRQWKCAVLLLLAILSEWHSNRGGGATCAWRGC